MKTTETDAARGPRAWMLVAVMTAVLLALLPSLWKLGVALLVEGERQRTDELSDAELPDHFRRLADLGTPGMEAVAGGLSSDRPAVIAAARATLLDMLAEFELLPAADAEERTLALSEWLSSHAAGMAPQGRAASAELAQRMLAGPALPETATQARVVAACERTLEATAADRPALAQRLAATRKLAAPMARAVAAGPHATSSNRMAGSVAQETSVVRFKQSSAEAREPANEVADIQPDHDLPTETSSNGEPRRLEVIQQDAQPLPRPRDAAGGEPIVDAAVMPAAAESPVAPDWRRLPWTDLLRQAASNDADEAAAARLELARRGFSPTEIELGRRLADSDPAARLRWTEAIPNLRGIDAGRWLEWLAGDEAFDVRRAAITLVATSGDDGLIDRVARAASRDDDPRIRRLAERIAADRAALRRQPGADDRGEP